MVHVKRAVGYIQIILGILLIFTTIIASSLIFNQINKNIGAWSESLSEAANHYNLSFTPKEQFLMAQNAGAGLAMGIGNMGITIIAAAIIIVILSVMMILQGVANTRTGSEDDMTYHELGHFIFSIVLVLYLLGAIAYIILQKPDIGTIFWLLLLLAAIAVLPVFVKQHLAKIKVAVQPGIVQPKTAQPKSRKKPKRK
jgi:hypothetical protein